MGPPPHFFRRFGLHTYVEEHIPACGPPRTSVPFWLAQGKNRLAEVTRLDVLHSEPRERSPRANRGGGAAGRWAFVYVYALPLRRCQSLSEDPDR
jgi:hypothetical protein